MPQLDKITFAAQILWLLPICTLLYWILLQWILPNIALTLKLRNRLTKELALTSASLNNEGFLLIKKKESHINNLIKITLTSIKKIKHGLNFNQQIYYINSIHGNEFNETNKIVYNKLNSIYIILALVKQNSSK